MILILGENILSGCSFANESKYHLITDISDFDNKSLERYLINSNVSCDPPLLPVTSESSIIDSFWNCKLLAEYNDYLDLGTMEKLKNEMLKNDYVTFGLDIVDFIFEHLELSEADINKFIKIVASNYNETGYFQHLEDNTEDLAANLYDTYYAVKILDRNEKLSQKDSIVKWIYSVQSTVCYNTDLVTLSYYYKIICYFELNDLIENVRNIIENSNFNAEIENYYGKIYDDISYLQFLYAYLCISDIEKIDVKELEICLSESFLIDLRGPHNYFVIASLDKISQLSKYTEYFEIVKALKNSDGLYCGIAKDYSVVDNLYSATIALLFYEDRDTVNEEEYIENIANLFNEVLDSEDDLNYKNIFHILVMDKLLNLETDKTQLLERIKPDYNQLNIDKYVRGYYWLLLSYCNIDSSNNSEIFRQILNIYKDNQDAEVLEKCYYIDLLDVTSTNDENEKTVKELLIDLDINSAVKEYTLDGKLEILNIYLSLANKHKLAIDFNVESIFYDSDFLPYYKTVDYVFDFKHAIKFFNIITLSRQKNFDERIINYELR